MDQSIDSIFKILDRLDKKIDTYQDTMNIIVKKCDDRYDNTSNKIDDKFTTLSNKIDLLERAQAALDKSFSIEKAKIYMLSGAIGLILGNIGNIVEIIKLITR